MTSTTTLPILSKGDSGADVSWVQYLLTRRGLVYQQIDGRYGDYTRKAVILFQNDAGLETDGVVGPLTWATLKGDRARPPTLSDGSHGTVVSDLQTGLNTGRGSFAPDTDPVLVVDGVYGPKTAKAIRGTQTKAEITADGIVGLQTWAVPVGADSAVIASLCGVTTPGT